MNPIQRAIYWFVNRGRKYIYRAGIRPKPGSIWFSPMLSTIYFWRDAMKEFTL